MRYAIAILLGFTVALSWAQDRMRSLPSGTSQILVRGETYYYAGGSFYRQGEGSYLRVEPPVGARVPDVPGDSGSFTMGGERYFVTSGGAFLRYDPRGDDYAVVSPPHGWRDYYRAPPELRSLAAPRAADPPRDIPRASPAPDPAPRAYSDRYRTYSYRGYPGGGYYGRYSFRDDLRGESYQERRSTCRRIADDQSRRANVGPYRREPGSYRDEYERCMR